jgi:L-ascorbate metabolism protein UlaG (beta-lactamase superfamily)
MRHVALTLSLAGVIACNSRPHSPSEGPAASPTTPFEAPPLPAGSIPQLPASGQAPMPSASAPIAPSAAVTDTLETSAGPVTLTPIQHATLALSTKDKTIVIDPWSKAPDGWLPPADLILITDIHQDHFDKAALSTVRKPKSVFVAPPAVAKDLPEAKVLKNSEKLELFGIRLTAVPMYNLTRGPEPGKLFHDKGRGNGYLIGIGDKTIYVSGDTECTPEMKALKNVDLAFVCMNLPYTMPPEEAAECVKAFKPKVVIPYHYRGSDLATFKTALAGTPGVEVRTREFYASH